MYSYKGRLGTAVVSSGKPAAQKPAPMTHDHVNPNLRPACSAGIDVSPTTLLPPSESRPHLPNRAGEGVHTAVYSSSSTSSPSRMLAAQKWVDCKCRKFRRVIFDSGSDASWGSVVSLVSTCPQSWLMLAILHLFPAETTCSSTDMSSFPAAVSEDCSSRPRTKPEDSAE